MAVKMSPYVYAGLMDKVRLQFTSYENNKKIEQIKKYFFAKKIGGSNTYKYPTKFAKFEEDLISGKRSTGLVQCRTLIAYIMRNEYCMNLTQIGLNLGGRDHSTVINMFNRFEAEKGQKRWVKILNDLEIE
jgi:hypothetical protein